MAMLVMPDCRTALNAYSGVGEGARARFVGCSGWERACWELDAARARCCQLLHRGSPTWNRRPSGEKIVMCLRGGGRVDGLSNTL